MFIDEAKILVKAGDGGNGAVSFHREKYVAAGGPDGGDGGRGGDIVFQVDDNLSTLAAFTYRRKYNAEDGEAGKGKRATGKSGKDLPLTVPRGTLVYDDETGRLLADLSGDDPVVIAKGGRGGFGNAHFANPSRQTPRFAKPGIEGERYSLRLELKLLADVGLVGFPNVGKSTFISVVSEARPKVANYHFTTLIPSLGVVRYTQDRSFVVADIPGLIKGASEGVGLGHEFLRHIERCRVILHLVDVSGSEGRDPIEDFEDINFELRKFSDELTQRPMIVVANKADIATPEQIEAFRSYIENKGHKLYTISAAQNKDIRPLLDEIARLLDTLPPVKTYVPQEAPVYELNRRSTAFTVRKEDDVYMLEADWFMRAFKNLDPHDYESLKYMDDVLRRAGVYNKLKEMGIQEGDTVSILDFEFQYFE